MEHPPDRSSDADQQAAALGESLLDPEATQAAAIDGETATAAGGDHSATAAGATAAGAAVEAGLAGSHAAAIGPSIQDAILAAEPRNMLLLALQQIAFRIGWIFKTESVIMPAVLDAIAANSGLADWQGVWRSWLPVLNRFGQSVPPLFYAPHLKAMRRKRISLTTTTFLMAGPLLVMALPVVSQSGLAGWRSPAVFLLMYGLFFALAGLNNLAYGAVQGRLIAPERRGRLLAVSASIGAGLACLFAWWLMRRWLGHGAAGYPLLFMFTAGCFMIAGCCSAMLREPLDESEERPPRGPAAIGLGRLFREDANFRRLALVAGLFSMSMILFPHYQALARVRLGLEGEHLMYWVIAQNAAVGVASLAAGPLADRRGVRAALRWTVLLSCAAPLLAIGFSYLPRESAGGVFWLVFLPLGLSPMTLKLLANYTLEASPQPEHPRYLSALALCLAAPFLSSPLVGWLVETAGFDVVFVTAAGVIAAGGLLVGTLREPRHG